MSKGFATNKAPQNQPKNTQDQNNAAQIQALTQMVIQSSQVARQLQEDVGLLTNLLRFNETEVVKDGDFVVIDAVGHLIENGAWGPPLPEASLLSHALYTKNSDNYAEGFVASVLGKSKGDQYYVDVTFPEDHSTFPGKELRFKVSVLKVLDTTVSDASFSFLDA